jgi:hypothetical protein
VISGETSDRFGGAVTVVAGATPVGPCLTWRVDDVGRPGCHIAVIADSLGRPLADAGSSIGGWIQAV